MTPAQGPLTTCLLAAFLTISAPARTAAALQASGGELPQLTQPVNDFANVIDAGSTRELERLIRELEAKTGDIIVVATVANLQPYADIREYAVKLFENRGRGIGSKGQDNGLLILLAPNDRRVRVEVGYGLEQWITDGFAGETSRDFMTPEFRQGRYGPGLLAGATRIAARIAQGRNVVLTGVEPLRERQPRGGRAPISIGWIILFFILIVIISRLGGGPGRSVRRWGHNGWSGWSSGVGPFGGGFGGGRFGGGGFGGGFGGFGGGRSGGGGGGSSW
jgi:uncharacterized protein